MCYNLGVPVNNWLLLPALMVGYTLTDIAVDTGNTVDDIVDTEDDMVDTEDDMPGDTVEDMLMDGVDMTGEVV